MLQLERPSQGFESNASCILRSVDPSEAEDGRVTQRIATLPQSIAIVEDPSRGQHFHVFVIVVIVVVVV